MSSTAPASLPQTEDEKVVGWRQTVLTEAGYPPDLARQIATYTDIDLHRAVDLIGSGCSHETAIKILL